MLDHQVGAEGLLQPARFVFVMGDLTELDQGEQGAGLVERAGGQERVDGRARYRGDRPRVDYGDRRDDLAAAAGSNRA